MLTTGEAISKVQRFHLNPGSDVWKLDQEERERMRFLLTGVVQQIWTRCPWWFKRGRGSVVLTAGVGSLPSDFGAFGTQGKVYRQGANGPPLEYRPPETVLELYNRGASAGTPLVYTLLGVGATGLFQILAWPQDGSTLILEGYDRAMPELIDIPIAPVVAVNVAAGNLTGSYRYRITFQTTVGETEAGIESDALDFAGEQADLTEIPVSEARAVTGRRIWRNAAAAPGVYKLVGTLADNTTTTFTDNVADGALGVVAPTPATAQYTGLEVYPKDFHESLIMDGLQARAEAGVGKPYDQAWLMAVRTMWAAQDPAEHQAKLMPVYGQAAGLAGQSDYWRHKIPLS